jgi:hypothetical protein
MKQLIRYNLYKKLCIIFLLIIYLLYLLNNKLVSNNEKEVFSSDITNKKYSIICFSPEPNKTKEK